MNRSLRMEAVRIKLTGSNANKYDIYYRVHVEGKGWMNWVKNGAIAGTTGESKRIEAIQIQLSDKNSRNNPNNYNRTRDYDPDYDDYNSNRRRSRNYDPDYDDYNSGRGRYRY